MGDPPLISRHAEDVLIGPAQGHRPRSAPVNRPGPYRNARNRTSEVAPILRAVPFSDQANRDKACPLVREATNNAWSGQDISLPPVQETGHGSLHLRYPGHPRSNAS